MIGDILPLIITLFAVILILYLSYLFTKFIGGRTIKSRNSSCMKIVDTLVIAQDKSVVILRADHKYYLLSVSQTDVKLIKELEGFDENSAVPVSNGSIDETLDFRNILNQLLPKKRK